MFFRKRQYSYRASPSRSFSPIFLVGIVLLLSAFFVAAQVYQFFFATSDREAVAFSVASGESFAGVAQRLEDEDFISSAYLLRLGAKLSGSDVHVRAGTTTIVPGASYADILYALRYPSGEFEVSITIPEGYTLFQIGAAVRSALPHISEEEWNRVTGSASPFTAEDFSFLASKPAGHDLEGYLFPDTYRFYEGASAEDVVERMLKTMSARLQALDVPTGDASEMSVHELLSLASIIEREVRKPEEMREVADIFLKRLAIGMALQSDATVNYVTGGKDPSISFADRDLDTPYNTYQYPGLPPGPISNPGMNALRAVYHPAENSYYYFLTDAAGTVYYAETHDVHVLNKQKYL